MTVQDVPAPVGPQTPEAITQAQQAANAPLTGASKISSMEDLRVKAPQLYEAVRMGIALRIKSDQDNYLQRLKKALREENRR
jgi:hypothetical protein